MNLENLDLLSQKIESMLEALRHLKGEKADADKTIASQKAELESLRANEAEKVARIESLESQLAEKDSELEKVKAELASRDEKIAEMDGIVSEQGNEIQKAREKFQNLLSTIESELGTEISVQSPEAEKAPEQSEENASQEESAQGDFFA
jgi:chromosome segregation ATPase